MVPLNLRTRLSLRAERRRLQIRALCKARELTPVTDRDADAPNGTVVFATLRNEAPRLTWFLHHYRLLGAAHFVVIDNGSTDGGPERLVREPDVSLWTTSASYRAARFGADWINALAPRYAGGRWLLWVDPDELLVYPHHRTRNLDELTAWLDRQDQPGLGTVLLDLYGRDSLAETHCADGQDPVAAAPWFDPHNYAVERNRRYHNLWIQGGPRMRRFFADRPALAPALNKIPLVRWSPGQVFVSSTHVLLPRRLNRVYGIRGESTTSGVLLHTKFLRTLWPKVTEELARREHYANGAEYAAYAAAGDRLRLWTPQSERYTGDWRQLARLGLMSAGGWA